jgi:cytochrome c oxidase subunit I
MTTTAGPTAVRPAPEASPGLILSWLGSTDHKRIAAHLGWSCGVFLIVGGLVALTMHTELAQPGLQFLSRDRYNELYSLHGATMIYFVMTPAALALGVYLVPLQIGAADLVAPRLNLFALWLMVGGALISFSALLTAGGYPRNGWTELLPLSNDTFSPGTGTDLWLAGVTASAFSAMILAGTVLTTICLRRAPGMTMLRIPVFSWTMVVTCLNVLFAFPALVAAMALIFLARHTSIGIDPNVYLNLFWFYGHPVVYVMFFPFVGAALEVLATAAGRRMAGYGAFVLAILGFAATSMAVWGHHMFTTGQVTNQYFSVTSIALLVFAGVEYLDALLTMWGGAIVLRTSTLFALGFFLQFLVGGLTGIFLAAPTLDNHVNDTYFVVGHFHYTLFAGSLFGLFAGIYHWYPKATGRRLGEHLGKLHFWLLVAGTNLTFFPFFVLGYEGMVRRVADYPHQTVLADWNLVSTIGSYVVAVALLVFVVNLVRSHLVGDPAGDDPWQGHTLEWWTASPPPRHNFDSLPPIRSHAPLLDLREASERP